MDVKENIHLQSQTLSYTKAIAEIFYTVLYKRSPLDKELKQYFRIHNECGSQDRLYIRESCFSLFRWYGWLQKKLPLKLSQKPSVLKKFYCGLAVALWLDSHDNFPFFSQILKLAYIKSLYLKPSGESLREKEQGLGKYFKIKELDILQLVPEWFVGVLPKNIDIEIMIKVLQQRPPVWIRVQSKSQEFVKKQFIEKGIEFTEPLQELKAIQIQTEKFSVNHFSSYKSGGFELQDLASQCIGLVCRAKENEMWWDVCAGSGGKSLLLADEMQGKGKIIATDIREKILEQLKKRIKRTQYTNIKIKDLGDVCLSKELFDGVLVDAPCSCTGIWRRNPDLRWTASADICEKSTQNQLEILKMASMKVKEKGVLIYATCSLSRQENEEVVNDFLKQNKNFQLDNFINPLSGEQINGMLRINFQPFDNDGMFVSRLIKLK